MRSIKALALAACVALTCAPGAAQPIAPDVFGALPDIQEAQISPNGRHLAMLENKPEGAAVVIYDLDDPSQRPVGVRAGSVKARDLIWADDERLLLLASVTDTFNTSGGKETWEFWRWVSISRTRKTARIILESRGGYIIQAAGELLAIPPQTPGRALFHASRGANGAGLVEVDLDSGSERFIEKNRDSTFDWVVDRTGRAVARLDYGANEVSVSAREPDGGWRVVKKYVSEPLKPSQLSLGDLIDDGQTLAASVLAGDTRAVAPFDLQSGAVGETIFQHGAYDLDGFGYDARRARTTNLRYTDDFVRVIPFDSRERAFQEGLEKAIPNAAPVIVSRSDDGRRVVIRAIYPNKPADFLLYSAETGKISRIAPSYRALDGRALVRRVKYDYGASDGTRVSGYLTIPADKEKKSLPLIVLPHGGPEARDNLAFDWWAGFYAARGYLVYQPNFRGSSGFGYAFRDAGHGEWGRKMQSDITEGVMNLIADRAADPERICIVGASYGGYAALAGAALTPDLYACAVAVAGVSDLPAMLGWSKERAGKGVEDFWESRMGASRFKDTDELNAVSPAKQADKIRAPILLIHGKDDTVVPVSQSRKMRDALNRAKKPVEYLELAGEDHWLSRAPSRIEMLRASIDFIDRHIGAGAP
jgi:dipeptidyl aminopeptidase/acylaminoacyl peptidase